MNKTYPSNKYGDVEILDASDRHAVRVRFIDTGHETTARLQNIVAGKVTDRPVKAARTAARKKQYARHRNEVEKADRVAARAAHKRKQPPADMVPGSRHKTKHRGDVYVEHYQNAERVEIIFADTGYRTNTSAQALRRCADLRDPLAPTVFGVGRVGLGKYRAYASSNTPEPAYQTWRAMLRRCYGTEHRPAYADVTVCEEWHDYQAFAAWYEANYPQLGFGYELDKDIMLPGNRTYSPEACQFVTRQQNLAARHR